MRNGLDSNGRLNGRLEDLVLGDLLAARAETHKAETFLQFRDGAFTYGEVDQMSNRVAQGLIAAGVRPGHHVAVMLPNCPELVFVIFALARLGAVAVPVNTAYRGELLRHVLATANISTLIVDRQYVDRLPPVASAVPDLLRVIMRGDGVTNGSGPRPGLPATSLSSLLGHGADRPTHQASFSDLLAIMYTSGTTGPSKGVEITHANVLAQLASIQALIAADEHDTALSYLPDAHAANRVGAQYLSLGTGIQIRTVADPRTLVSALAQVRPTFFGGVPQIWYKIKTAIETGVAAEPSPAKRRLATWALRTGTQVARLRSDRKPVPLALRAQHVVADRLVLSALRAKLGMDRVRSCVSGAAPIAPDALAFMLGLGIPISEVWGMSELTAIATANPADGIRIGTVGPAVLGMQVKIADDGEVLARGPSMMRGYRNDPEKTAETIDPDGWLHTGDIGTLDEDGYLRIVDRKKELIINAAGKNMSPSNIEGTVKATCPLAGSVVAIGDNRKYVVALLTLDPEAAAGYAAQHGLPDSSPKALHDNAAVLAQVAAGIDAANQRLSRVEQIKKFAVLPAVWETGGDELTPTMKLKRKPIGEKYATEIDQLYL